GWSRGVRAGLTPPKERTETSTWPGARSRTQRSNSGSSRAGSWSATRRNDTLAWASAGMMVLDPTPVKPPQMPLTSAVGRPDIRSRGEYPTSPGGAPPPGEALARPGPTRHPPQGPIPHLGGQGPDPGDGLEPLGVEGQVGEVGPLLVGEVDHVVIPARDGDPAGLVLEPRQQGDQLGHGVGRSE